MGSPENLEEELENMNAEADIAAVVGSYVRQMEIDANGSEIIDDTESNTEDPWFEVEIQAASIGGNQSVTRLRKAWSEFQRFHFLLLTDEFGCNSSVQISLPVLPNLSEGNSSLIAELLTSYCQSLLCVPSVVQSAMFSGFLRESVFEGRDNAPDETFKGPKTAIGFLLQPFAPHCIYVPRRQEYCRELIVLKNESVAWQFGVDFGMDIDFTMEFTPQTIQRNPGLAGDNRRQKTWLGYPQKTNINNHEEGSIVHRKTRYGGAVGHVQGSYTCSDDGLCTLRWGNSYSRFRGKTLYYIAETVAAETMKAAVQAADACAFKAMVSHSAAAEQIINSINGDVKIIVRPLLASSVVSSPVPDDNGIVQCVSDARCSDFSLRKSASNLVYGILKVTPLVLRSLALGEGRTQEVNQPLIGPEQDPNCELEENELSPYEKRVAALVVNYEKLEDELANMSARRAQAEAQAKVLLAQLQRVNADLNRTMECWEDTKKELFELEKRETRLIFEKDEALKETVEAKKAHFETEKSLLGCRRERDLLQAERSVWQVSRNGIQAELARTVTALEGEKHACLDVQAMLRKAQEKVEQLESEKKHFIERLAIAEDNEKQDRIREEAIAARAEVSDSRQALIEIEAINSNLRAEKSVLGLELRQMKKSYIDQLSAARAEAEEARMIQRSLETQLKKLELDTSPSKIQIQSFEAKIQRLRAERKVLIGEIRKCGNHTYTSIGSASGSDQGAPSDVASVFSDNESNIDRTEKIGRSFGSAYDRPTMIKQLSRQLVHLRERQQEIKDNRKKNTQIQASPELERDLEQEVLQLQSRVRILLAEHQASNSVPRPI